MFYYDFIFTKWYLYYIKRYEQMRRPNKENDRILSASYKALIC